jgi:hypothetical protein
MARKTKYQPNEINAELVLFSRAANAKYDSDSFACGYYESMLTTLLAELPKHKQEELLHNFRVSTAKLGG